MSSTPPPPPPTAPLTRSQTTCAEYMSAPVNFAVTPTCPPPLQRCITSACSSYYPEPPLLRRTDTSADYARGDDYLARLSRLERDSLRMQQDLADLSERMRASIPPPSSPVSRQIASPSPAPAPGPAPQTADATSPHFPFSVATVDMMNNFGM